MDVALVMEELAARLATVDGLRDVHSFPPSAPPSVSPFGVVEYPTVINFDASYGRGRDEMDLMVTIHVANPTDKHARDRIVKYASGSGASSVKQVLQTGTYTTITHLHVSSVEFMTTIWGVKDSAPEYLTAVFTVKIRGKGSP